MSAITPAIRPAIGPAIRSAFEGGAPSLLAQSRALVRKYGGALYDPSNLASLFQDSAGTIPVTAAGQPVGLMLDVSQPPGPDTAVNGNFASDLSGWTQTDPGYWQWVAGRAFHPFSSAYKGLQQAIPTDKSQEITASLDVTSGNALVFVTMPSGVKTFSFSAGQHTFRVITEKGSTILGFARSAAGAEFYVDNVTVRAIPGFHASQSTTTARPTYQIIDGYPCIVGDGVDDFLRTGAQIPAGPDRSTTLMVGARLLSETGDYRYLAGAGNSSPLRVVGIQRNTIAQNSYTGFGNYGTAVYTPPAGTQPNNITRVLALINRPDTPRSELFINGVAVANKVTTQGANASGPMNVSLLSYHSGGTNSNAAIFAAAYLPAAATPAEQLGLTRFIASRSGVTL